MVRQKIGILLLICFFLLFINPGLFAETDSSQRDGPFVMVGQVSGGLFGQSIGFLVVGVSLLYVESLIFGETYLSEIHLFSPGVIYGGMVGAMFGSAGTVHLIGETFGSGGGSFKETLKWSPLTPIGATIGYQRSKRKQPPSISLANGKFTLHLPTMRIQSSQLPYHHPQTDYRVRLVNVRF